MSRFSERLGTRAGRFAGRLLIAALFAGAEVAAADGIGRLFTSPDERARLDALRARPEPVPDPEAQEASPAAAAPPAERRPMLTVSGVVKRRGGRSTVWINGVDSYAGDLSRLGVAVVGRPGGTGAVPLTTDRDERVTLKPGQSFDPESGTIVGTVRSRVPESAAEPKR